MSSGLDMSLDEIIQNKKRSRGRNGNPRGRGSGHGPGPDRLASHRDPVRVYPYTMRPLSFAAGELQIQRQVPMWQQQAILTEGYNAEAKLYVSNLDHGVSNEDIKVLFSEVGDLKSYSIHYDRIGRPKGSAEVTFYHQTDALAAIKRYNNVRLDGKPMNIELVGGNLVPVAPLPLARNGILMEPIAAIRSVNEMVGGRTWPQSGGNGRGSRGRGSVRSHGPERTRVEKLSAEDLDADLDNYRLEAMRNK